MLLTRLTGSQARHPQPRGGFGLVGALLARPSRLLGLLVCAGLAMAVLSPPESAAQARPGSVARAVSVQGTVEARRVGETQWQPVKLNDTYAPGDTIRVHENSRADLAILGQSVLRLNAGTTLTLEAVKDERTGVVELLKGAAHFLSRGPRSLEVRTPFTTAGVRGTEFYVSVGDDRTLLSVFEGEVLASNQAGSLALSGGQSALAEQGKAPVQRVVARPRDAVQWALYYPPVVYFGPNEFPAGPDWPGAVRASLEAYTTGDLQKAFDSIRSVPPSVSDSRFFVHRASLLLAVGRVDAAGADIEQALKLRANDPNALALQSIVAIVQDEKDRALQIAQGAVQAAPDSGSALVALSYAQQAKFDLPGARRSLEEAVKREPQNALAWARLAELHASFGDLDKALQAAQQAVTLEPNLARTQTVLGYAYLTQTKVREAREAFEKAITLDQADPLPRLGLGLAKIRQSKLDEGGRDIEAAASLDPNNALVRSYLGKAYYEEKRAPLDAREYSVAKQLDPNDPTPWFYDAIQKQTTNRPVEALRDLEKAIELNKNRAVYRSSLLLDSDEAARSASIARVFTDLGFEQLALVEGWKSVNTDPTNFSGHRLLSDLYSVKPRHEIGRVSELFQSQMLQPLNSTPIQPRLAESNLFLISAGGPGTTSFNEFNPLFNRDRVTFLLSGLVGEHDTYGGEAVIAGIFGKTAFSVGYTHFETDGFRVNNDQTDDIVNVFIQHDLSYRTSVQAEFRYRKTENGDLQLNFFPEDILANFRQSAESYTARAGFRHAFSPASILLGSVMYQHRDDSSHDENEPAIPFVTSLDSSAEGQEGIGGELQHLFRSMYVNLTSGLGYFRITGDQRTVTQLDFPEGPLTLTDVLSLDAHHFNVYAYSYINFPQTVTWTLGVSFDMFDTDSSASLDTDQVNPKVGVTWNPFPGTTLRAAVFRVLKRTLITEQTLEPTQVAGFNQFFDDEDSTESWRYGGAIDQRFMSSLYGGVEFSVRELDVPTLLVTETSTGITRRDWREYQGRAYLFWTPHPWVALTLEYIYERFEQDEIFNFGFTEVRTHRVPVGVRLFHPSGLGLSVKATYVNQDGEFVPRGSDCCVSGSDDFWVVDAAVHYRLPKRFGILTVGVTNLFDEQFKYQETDVRNASIQPARAVFARLTLAFP